MKGDWPQGRTSKIFISHSAADTSVARTLAQKLRNQGHVPWIFEDDNRFGAELHSAIRDAILSSDFFILILSSASISSSWCQKELALANSVNCNKHRNRREIFILGYKIERQTCTNVPLVDFDTSEYLGEYQFSTQRYFDTSNPDIDREDLWIRSLDTEVNKFGLGFDVGSNIPISFFDLFSELFANEAQMDAPENIKYWFDESPETINKNWKDLLVVHSVLGQAIAFCLLCLYPEDGLVYGDYFGVSRRHRQQNRARDLLNDARAAIFKLHKDAYWRRLWQAPLRKWPLHPHGIIFDVDLIDREAISSFVSKYVDGEFVAPISEVEIEAVRSAKRIALYEHYGARVFLMPDTRPYPFLQPAIRLPLDSSNEVPMALMYWPLATPVEEFVNVCEFHSVLRFLYMKIYGDSYERCDMTGLPGYRKYIEEKFREAAAAACGDIVLGSLLQEVDIKKALYIESRVQIVGRL